MGIRQVRVLSVGLLVVVAAKYVTNLMPGGVVSCGAVSGNNYNGLPDGDDVKANGDATGVSRLSHEHGDVGTFSQPVEVSI